MRAPLTTTVPAPSEAFHILPPDRRGADRLRDFVLDAGMGVWFLDAAGLERAFELTARYRDHPMDLADASLVVAAASPRTRSIFNSDRRERGNLANRRSLWAVADIAAGERLTEANVRSIRPGHGLAPKHLPELLVRTARTAIARGTPLDWGLVQ